MKLLLKGRAFFLCLLLLLTGCQSTWAQAVPNTDLIYQSQMNNPYVLNFINADGTNQQMVKVNTNFVKTVWSPDGSLLYGLSSHLPPYPDTGYPAYWDIKKGRFKVCSENLPLHDEIQGF